MSDTLFSTGPVAPADAAPDLSAAIRAIAARCDGAQDHDGVGFNGQDTHFGRALAMVPAEKWTPEVTVEAHRTLRKYRGQLASAGIDYDALPVPEGAAAENATANRDARSDAYAMRRDATSADARKIRLDGQRLIIEFPYDQKRVAAVKQIPGARWDGAAKVWTIPIESGRAAVDTFPDFHIGEGILEAVEHAPPPPPARRIEGDGRRYLVWFPYDGRLVDLMRGVPGARWDKELGCWGVGVSPVAAAALRPLIDEGFEDLAGLSAEAEPVAAMVELSRAQDLDGFEVPGLRREPYPYQRAGIAYAAAARRTFIADEMGLGKTAQALGTIEAVQTYPALVVCPVKIRTNWAREAEAWLPEGKRIAVVVPPSTPRDEQARMAAAGFTPLLGQPRPGFDIYITGYPLLHTQVEAWAGVGLKGLVLDESHYCKGRDKVGVCPACGSEMTRKGACKGPEEHVASKRQQRKVYKVLWTRAAKAISETIPSDGVVLALSGTPNKNTPQDFVAQLDILGRLDDLGGEWHFLTRWCGAYRDSWGWRTGGASNLAELNERLRSTCYIRRAKADVLPDLPALDRREGRVELDTTDMAEYRRIEADFLSFIAQRAAELAEEEGEDPSSAAWEARLRAEAAEHLVRITTLRRSAAAAKIGIAKEWVEQFLDETDRKLIVFAHHREVVEALANEFDCERIDGGTSDSMGAVDRFQNDPNVRVIVIGIMAGGVGLTLTAASDMLFIEQAWTPADLDQAEARAYGRVNDAHGATATYLLADGTIDEDMWELIGEKRVVFHAAADGEAMAPSKKQSVAGDLLVRMARRALANAPEA